MITTAIYPGTFDPITHGHTDIVSRASAVFDRLIVGVAASTGKKTVFSADERVALASEILSTRDNVEVRSFDGLMVKFAREIGATVILRGLRAVSDFEYEMEMALMNRRLSPTIETVLMMPAESYTYLSSRLVKEIFALGGSIRGLVPDVVEACLEKKASGDKHRYA